MHAAPKSKYFGKMKEVGTENFKKLLKDCMTAVGFWKDDAQVVREYVEKRWADEPSGIYIEIEELEDNDHV